MLIDEIVILRQNVQMTAEFRGIFEHVAVLPARLGELPQVVALRRHRAGSHKVVYHLRLRVALVALHCSLDARVDDVQRPEYHILDFLFLDVAVYGAIVGDTLQCLADGGGENVFHKLRGIRRRAPRHDVVYEGDGCVIARFEQGDVGVEVEIRQAFEQRIYLNSHSIRRFERLDAIGEISGFQLHFLSGEVLRQCYRKCNNNFPTNKKISIKFFCLFIPRPSIR